MGLMHSWGNASPIHGASFVCPYCGRTHTPLALLGATSTWRTGADGKPISDGLQTKILACTACTMPYISFAQEDRTVPNVRLGSNLRNLPEELSKLYDEARDASSVGAHTACAMVARKALMNLAVLEGAEEDKSFQFYVDFLAANGFVPPRGKPWVDKIRTTGNAATHEIEIVSAEGAKDVMYLLENLLRFNFEMTGPSA